jgi:hypothetical protein
MGLGWVFVIRPEGSRLLWPGWSAVKRDPRSFGDLGHSFNAGGCKVPTVVGECFAGDPEPDEYTSDTTAGGKEDDGCRVIDETPQFV